MLATQVQEYSKYTSEDTMVWKLLFERQMKILPSVASKEYLEGLRVMNFKKQEVPNFKKINQHLSTLTGWAVTGVTGIIDPIDFFPLLANRKFPVTTWLRQPSQLDFIAEPDLFHDIMGHLPLLSNQVFCDFCQQIGALGGEYLDRPKAVQMLGCLYWYTVEFGLIKSEGKEKIYGAGILSSYGEIQSALSETSEYIPFDVEKILNAEYNDSHIQHKYFVIESFEQLYHAMDEIKIVLDRVA
jgi:phenylalanine-4-hydroxylase